MDGRMDAQARTLATRYDVHESWILHTTRMHRWVSSKATQVKVTAKT